MVKLLRSALLGLSVPVLLVCAACSSESDGSSAQATITLALTDAPSDEIASFRIEVESFRILRASGAGVSVLAAPVEIDLASLTDLSQVLNVKSVPVGVYSSAEVTFDFSDAVCVLHGNPVPATILDPDGQPLSGALTLPIDLGQGPLAALAGKHKLLELDFDLDQSLVVDAGANTVSLEPVLVLRIDPLGPKQLLVVGSLNAVDLPASTFTAEVKTLAGATIGTLLFEVGPLAVYQIDGVPIQGATGLAALAVKGPEAWVQVYGAVDPESARLFAFHVAAGTGTFNGGSDIVAGHVLARSSGAGTSATLTVRGHSSNAAHTIFQFNTTFTVSTSFAATKVLVVGAPTALDLDAVNVGQLVRVFGALSGTSMDASSVDDVIRPEPTRTYGHALGPPAAGRLTMDLSRVGLLPEGNFTWGDSGANPPDPSSFTVAVAGLANGLSIETGTAVEARGYFAPVDDPREDLSAISVSNLDSAPSLLFVRNRMDVGFDLIVTATASAIQLQLSGLAAPGEVALIDKGFAGALSLPASPTPAIEPPASGVTLYFITDKVLGGTTLYLSFAEFSDALAMGTAQGANVGQVAAIGTYDAATNTVKAPLASVCLK